MFIEVGTKKLIDFPEWKEASRELRDLIQRMHAQAVSRSLRAKDLEPARPPQEDARSKEGCPAWSRAADGLSEVACRCRKLMEDGAVEHFFALAAALDEVDDAVGVLAGPNSQAFIPPEGYMNRTR